MPLHKLSIFAKDTSANATIKGYEFQKLRTLEVWLESYLIKADEVTYCEYQDDIFKRNQTDWICQFRQLKLYSSKNFSFKSEEVTKAIFNFFMLFVKGEFKFDDVQFWFETNTGIARRNGENGADLLKEWHKNQENLLPELLSRCATKIKEIVTSFLEGEASQNIEFPESDPFLLVNNLSNAVWLDFTSRIHWEFNDISPEKAIENLITRIREMIVKTGFPIALQQPKAAFYSLIYEISKRSMNDQPEDRKLDNALMDSILITTIDQLENGYAEDWDSWNERPIIHSFRAAEFYQVIGTAYYCHSNGHLRHHLSFWQNILHQYIALEEIPMYYVRKAICELIWCANFNPDNNYPDGSLLGFEPHIQIYFETLKDFKDYESISEAISLLSAVIIHVLVNTCALELSGVMVWQRRISVQIDERIKNAGTGEETSYYNELAAFLIIEDVTGALSHNKLKDVLPHYEAILEGLDQAPQYNVVFLADRINKFLDQLMAERQDHNDIDGLQDISNRLLPYVNSKETEEANAMRFIAQGDRYLESADSAGILKALTCFHKAKALYRQDKTKKGYVLSIMNISQLYNIAGCDLAAKYYAMSAAWHCSQYDKLHDMLPDAMGLVFHMDHAQGSWLSSLEGFRLYINARAEYGTGGDFDMFDKNLQECAFLFSAAPKLSMEIIEVLNKVKSEMKEFYELYLEAYIEEDNQLSVEEINNILNIKLHDRPLNDAGEKRTIQWDVAGLSWKIHFKNTWMMTSVAEEFCAILQILLLELSLSQKDLHLLETSIEVDIIIGVGYKEPVRGEEKKAHWTIQLPMVLKDDYSAIEKQTPLIIATIGILLEELSLLPENELVNTITLHFDRENLAGKTLPDFIYQRLYRNLFTESTFNFSARASLQKVNSGYIHKTFAALRWNSNESPHYDKERALNRIRERYVGFNSNTYLTLKAIQQDPAYPDFIADLKRKGWLDWQILMAISNHSMTNKVNALLLKKKFSTQSERVEAYRQEAMRIQPLTEDKTYIPVSLNYFLTERFKNQLNNVAVLVLDEFGLKYHTAFPDFEAVNKFAKARLHFGEDDLPGLSPFR